MSRIVFVLLIAVAVCSAKFIGVQEECGENQESVQCGTACEPSCEHLNPVVCTYQCVIGCQCKEGYVRNNKNECVDPVNC